MDDEDGDRGSVTALVAIRGRYFFFLVSLLSFSIS